MKKFILIFLLIISIFIISCSTIIDESNETKTEDQAAQYGQAIMELNQEGNNSNGLDKRYNILDKKIDKILSEEMEFNMAEFTRIKIELDFLEVSGYDVVELAHVKNKFQQAYLISGESVVEEDYSGMSLGDRYYELNRSIDSFREEELSVKDYLQLEKNVKVLQDDGYPVEAKIDELKSNLLEVVLLQLQSAIVNFDIPEEEEVIEEPELPEEDVEPLEEELPEEAVEEEVVEEPAEPLGPRTHVITLIPGGFNTAGMTEIDSEDFDNFEIHINVDDTVEWKNMREGNYNMALLVGNRECRDIKSGFFYSGESYSWHFTEPMICWVSDAIFTTQAMKIVVS